MLKLLERVTGVPATGISSWRRNLIGDLTGAFRWNSTDPVPPVLPDTSDPLALADYTSTLTLPAFPGAQQSFPRQDPGDRPHTGRRRRL